MFKNIPNWVLWKYEKRGGKMTKIPYQISGEMASSTDERTWNTYEDVEKHSSKYSGIGFVLPLDNSILAIDLDKCLSDTGEILIPEFKTFVEKSKTYTEISPSKKGLHLFFYVEGGVKLEAHRSTKMPGFEVYSSGRYFTMTNTPYGEKKSIRIITQEEATDILSNVGYPWRHQTSPSSPPSSSVSISLSDNEIIERMFNSKNGTRIKSLWDGDTSAYNNDDSAADMALCMHLAFWTQKDQARISSLWLSAPLGNRKKTQEREDYRNMTISHAIAATKDVYTPYAEDEFVKGFDLLTNKKGIPFINAENILRLIEKDELLSASFRYNDFNHSEETNFFGNEWREIEKRDINFCLLHIQRTYPGFERSTKNSVEDAISVFCGKHSVNPIKDKIISLEWDGEHRIDHWLHSVYGVPDTEYFSSVGANWLKGLVKRIIHPGCKFDYILILEGPQGWKKSESLSLLGNGFHVETVLSPDNKDFFMLLQRNTIVEFSEGHTMNRSDTRLLKSIITMREDQMRVPYGRGISRFPRHCVFAMTTNESTYLRDDTGNRRFLPVEIRKIADLEWLEANLEQLYAESYQRAIIDKETTWEFGEEIESIQQSKMVENPYSEKLLNWYFNLSKSRREEEGITAIEAYQSVWQDNVPIGREMSVVNTMQVTSLFSSVLKLQKKQIMLSGIRSMRWFPTKDTQKIDYQLSEMEKEFANF